MPETPRSKTAYTFDEHWITETLRLRESLWGPLEDASEAGRARARGGDFAARLLVRTRLLAQREGLDTALTRWKKLAQLVLMAFALAAIVAGWGAALGALGTGAQPVNLALAVAALLGLNTVTFLFWIVSLGMRAGSGGSLLADAWMKLTRRLARGPDAALLPRALMELLARQRASRWSGGLLSHALWTLALLAALATLLGLLATRRYTFQWETTLLSPDAFVVMTQGLGHLPGLLGFAQPPEDVIRASGGQGDLPETAHALWSGWLLGVLVVYGLIPRVAALVLSVVVVRRRLAALRADATLPGIAELHDRLMPPSEGMGIDAPAPPASNAKAQRSPTRQPVGPHCLLGLELPADLAWPPAELSPTLSDLGVVDTREQRHRLLENLRAHRAARLLVCCDARQTPDRGTLALLAELSALTAELRVALLPGDGGEARREQWREQLAAASLPLERQGDVAAGIAWLTAAMPSTESLNTQRDTGRPSPDTNASPGLHGEAAR